MKKLDQVIFYKLEKAIRAYRRFAQRQIRKAGFSITVDQWLTMKQILENPGVKQLDLAENVFKDNASVTRMIELLVKAGYIMREPHAEDRRRTDLTVTKLGREVLDEVSAVIVRNRRDALRGVDPRDLIKIDTVLARIVKNCLDGPTGPVRNKKADRVLESAWKNAVGEIRNT
ncbi:MAG: MarR family winged helix-turn-helix transcriptional regulator [Pyrinomonadaceae bacterium]